jgi:AraC family transcriptional regulator of adaptative response / DNA-3-methyladenine glycosylase II
VGASPVAVAQTRRILLAKRLINESALSMSETAMASGFGSIRRFNDAIRSTYARSPRELRRGRALRNIRASSPGLTIKLPFSPPYDWASLVEFLGHRAIPGVEFISPDRYVRTVAIDGEQGLVEVRPVAGETHLLATVHFPRLSPLAGIIGRLRRVFDLDADTRTIAAHLSTDPRMAAAIAARPGLRIPGAWDDFELAVRAILGQQVSVSAATRLIGRLVSVHGEPLAAENAGAAMVPLRFVFPKPGVLAQADLSRLGIPGARAMAISSLAASVARENGLFGIRSGLDEAVLSLRRHPGIGEWTAQYIAMRGLREPDAFPASDLGLRRAMAANQVIPTPKQLLKAAEAWRPWRAYAAMHLWLGNQSLFTETGRVA